MKDGQLSKMEQNIVNLLKYNGELNNTDLHARCTYNRTAIRNCCKKLEEAGLLDKTLKKKADDSHNTNYWRVK